jgi:hypothetical protein
MKILDMTHPELYFVSTMDLDNFLETLRSNFQSHENLFPDRNSEKVENAASFLSTLNNHPDLAQ